MGLAEIPRQEWGWGGGGRGGKTGGGPMGESLGAGRPRKDRPAEGREGIVLVFLRGQGTRSCLGEGGTYSICVLGDHFMEPRLSHNTGNP